MVRAMSAVSQVYHPGNRFGESQPGRRGPGRAGARRRGLGKWVNMTVSRAFGSRALIRDGRLASPCFAGGREAGPTPHGPAGPLPPSTPPATQDRPARQGKELEGALGGGGGRMKHSALLKRPYGRRSEGFCTPRTRPPGGPSEGVGRQSFHGVTQRNTDRALGGPRV